MDSMEQKRITLDAIERLVLKLANQSPTRYWKHWNNPCESPWFMAVEVQGVDAESRLIGELASRGLRVAGIPGPHGGTLFTVERDVDLERGCA